LAWAAKIPSAKRIRTGRRRSFSGSDSEGRQSRGATAKRTLTNLYNERPTWLDLARKLDEAVFAAYGWEPTLSDDEILTHLLALNHQRAATQ
jgi:hypothetical protein